MTDDHKTRAELIAELHALRRKCGEIQEDSESALRNKQQLRELEDAETIILSHISDAVLITDDAGTFTYVSPSVKAVFGYSPEEVCALGQIGRLLGYDFFSRRLLKERGELRNIQRRIRDKEGVPRVVLVRVRQVHLRGGSLLFSCRDISERSRAEEALLASEDRYRSLFENMGNGVAIYGALHHGRDFVCVDFNRAAEEITGVGRLNFIGQRASEVFPAIQEAGLLDVFRRVWRTGQPEHHPIMKFSRGSEERWTENFVYKLPSGEIVDVFSDQTNRIRTHQGLKESELRFRSLYENEHVVMLLIDPEELTIVDGNPAACSFYGFARKELTTKRLPDICILPEGRIRSTVREVLSGKSEHVEFRHRVAGGELRDVRVCSSPITVAGVPLLYSIVVDVSETTQALEELQKSEQRLAMALSGGELVLWDWRVDTGELFLTQVGQDRTGSSKWELKAARMTWESVVHPEDIASVKEQLSRHVAGASVRFEAEHRIRSKSGPWIWVLSRGRVSDQSQPGEPLRVSGTHLDITRLKEAELALRNSEDQLRTIFREWPDVILVIDVPTGKILLANRSAKTVLKYELGDLLGRHFSVFFPQEEGKSRHELIAKLRVSGGVFEAQRILRADGEEIPMDLMATLIKWGDDSAILAVFRDVSDRESAADTAGVGLQ
ncbi:MAG: PAS domain S-box protein [Thermodesulfobacteriota bacterium]